MTKEKVKLNTLLNRNMANAIISNAKIIDNCITSEKIQNTTILNRDMANNIICTAKLRDNSVSSANIIDGVVTAAKIANGAVTSAQIADGTIVNADISATAAIAASKIDTAGLDADMVDGYHASAFVLKFLPNPNQLAIDQARQGECAVGWFPIYFGKRGVKMEKRTDVFDTKSEDGREFNIHEYTDHDDATTFGNPGVTVEGNKAYRTEDGDICNKTGEDTFKIHRLNLVVRKIQ